MRSSRSSAQRIARPANRQDRGDRIARLYYRRRPRLRLECRFRADPQTGEAPCRNFGHDYQLDYGTDRLELHTDGIQRGEHVLLVDDLIATGGTAEAALRLIGIAGGSVVGCAFVVDLPDLGGRQRIERLGYPVLALCEFSGH